MRFVFISIAALSLVVPLSTPLHAGTPGTACQSAPYRQFDFFAGDWDAYSSDAPSKVIARNHVAVILGGCVIHEDYRQNDGLHGKSFSLYDAARRALATAFEKPPVIVGEGGSIPVVGDFERILGAPVLLVGFGLPGENAHAPDEWMSEENFRVGTLAMATLWDEYAKNEKS